MKKRIALLGVGLIGGSLGLAWKRSALDLTIVGFDEPAVLDVAYRRGALDERAASLEAAVTGADVVVLATPLAPMMRLLVDMAPYLRADTVVTDVGSVKTPVVQQARDVLPDHVTFVGGHPMAGSERGGIEYADAFLFENATYVLCPPDDEGATTLDRCPDLVELVEATGARLLLLDAARHDRIAAAVSHLPQLLAVALTNHAARLNDEDDAFLRLAAGGFRDLTRIASSPFNMWRQILVANRGPVLDALGGIAATIQAMRNRLIEEDLDAMENAFTDAARVRDTIPRDSKGFLHPLSDVYVFAEDRPGELLRITQTLFDAELNIKDIELLKIREGTGGAFRLSFKDDETADGAVDVLTHADFHAYRL